MKKNEVRAAVNYSFDWTFGVEIKKMREDLDAVEKLGATHIDIEYGTDYDSAYCTIQAVEERLETDEELATRKYRETKAKNDIKEEELATLKRLALKYGLPVLFLALFSPLLSFAQKKDKFWLKQGISAGVCFTAGWLHGTNEVSVHDYRRYAARHPRANPQRANPKLSFRNKYKNHPTDLRPAYFGSKDVLVFTTDAYHLRATVKNGLLAGNIGIAMTLYEKPKFKDMLIQVAASWAMYAIGTGAAHKYYKPI